MEHGQNTMKIPCPAAGWRAALALPAAIAPAFLPARAADPQPATGATIYHVQSTFASPEDAAKALVDAMRSDERKQLWHVLDRVPAS